MTTNKKLMIFLVVILIFPSIFVSASAVESPVPPNSQINHSTGEIAAKDEVVYATLHEDGDLNEIYVVNILDVAKAGTVIDYGPYDSVKNLTDLSDIALKDDTVQITAAEGKFYYQGNMSANKLPWNFNITYTFDGKQMTPQDLAGQSGRLQIEIETSENEQANRIFYENYLLQMTITLDSELAQQIQAPNATIANVGKNKQIVYTMLPGMDEKMTLEADVVDFEMDGIQISALPSSMAFDVPNIDALTEDMKTLSDAITDLTRGVSQLNDGVSAMQEGLTSLSNGSAQFHDGLHELNGSSNQLREASALIQTSLNTMNLALANRDESNPNPFMQLQAGLEQLADGLNESVTGLNLLRQNVEPAFNALDKAVEQIPDHVITEGQIKQLLNSDADPQTIEILLETYAAAQTVKGTYREVLPAFEAITNTLDPVIAGLSQMSAELSSIASAVTESASRSSMDALREGINQLAHEYEAFHAGIMSYTDGVAELAASYRELHSGVEAAKAGSDELRKGTKMLRDGTNELHKETRDLPDQMQAEIDELLGDFDKEDFQPVSFSSDKNSSINAVQFIIQTEKIAIAEEEVQIRPEEEKEGFWTRLKNLFVS